MSEMTHSRPPLTRLNYSGIVWCRPEVVAHPESPAGIIPPLWIFLKVTVVFHSSPFSHAEERNWSWWPIEDIVFPSLGFCGAFSTLPLEARFERRAPTARRKHTQHVASRCPRCLSICTREIMAFTSAVGSDFLARLLKAYSAPRCALCYRLPGKQWESQGWRRKHG